MNVNEVVAFVANHLDGMDWAEALLVDPLDHVNLHQSTNDVYPTACRLALARLVEPLAVHVHEVEETLRRMAESGRGIPRLARTCLRDAVDSDFEAYFGGCTGAWKRGGARLRTARAALHTVSIGGGIAGQPGSSPPEFRRLAIEELRTVTAVPQLILTESFADAAQNVDDVYDLACAVDILARILIKQAQDLRLLASGPDAGLGELVLPTSLAGSSAMPGKVNPVIPEFAIQCAMQVIGNSTVCGLATQQGELDLNVWEGVLVYNLYTSICLLTSALGAYHSRCLSGIRVVRPTNYLHSQVPAAKIARRVQQSSYRVVLREVESRSAQAGTEVDAGE
jgi:aspartate ammonia-lyase